MARRWDEISHESNEVILEFLEEITVMIKGNSVCTRKENSFDDRIYQQSPISNDVLTIVEHLYRIRTTRNRIFADTDIFGEPGWDILLDLYMSRAQKKRVSVTSACIASRVPPTTALRWLNHLEKEGMITRTDDSIDRRRALVEITDVAALKIENVVREYIGWASRS